MAGVWILAETRQQTLELLNIGKKMATRMGTNLAVLVWQDREHAGDYFSLGADQLFILPPLPDDHSCDAYLPTITEEVKQADPDLILVSATARGKDLAARLAARLDTGLCSGCIGMNYDDTRNTLEMERLAYGGAAIQKVTCSSRPCIATIPSGVYDAAVPAEPREGTIRELPMPPPSSIRILEKKAKERIGRDITAARVVICVGRGIQKEEDLALARELSEVLDGEIGCTRPISEEMHWLPEDLCIGLSGVQIKPDLYIGLGVSGQIQHITGIRNAKVICAINKDEHAPIFNAADFGIIGDLYDVVPKLIQELKKR
jgi:electron transfer flavoprotein alpha subunit